MDRTDFIRTLVDVEYKQQQCPLNLSKEIANQFSDLVKNDKQKRLFIRFTDPVHDNDAIFGHDTLKMWVSGLTQPFFEWAEILLPCMAENEQNQLTSHRLTGKWFVIESRKMVLVGRTSTTEWAHNTIIEHLIGLLLNIENFIVFIG